jgi:isopenicillin N synthase-like dioxygenase
MNETASPPVIDMRQATGVELVEGLQRASCVLLTGLGDLPAQARAAADTSEQFFALSEDEKAKVQWSGVGAWEGWQPLYAAKTNAYPLERFELALPNPADFASNSAWTATFAQWPAEPAQMESVWAVYYRSAWSLTERVLGMLSDALELPVGDLPAWTERQHSNLCINHYIPQIEAPKPGEMRQKPHTDHGGVTLLWTDGQPGLEAQIGPDGAWVPLIVPSDMVLLQAGDLLHLWSRRTIPANNHRVVNPPRAESLPQTSRYSLVYFHHPDLDSWIAPAEGDEPALNAREHVMARQRKSYSTA